MDNKTYVDYVVGMYLVTLGIIAVIFYLYGVLAFLLSLSLWISSLHLGQLFLYSPADHAARGNNEDS